MLWRLWGKVQGKDRPSGDNNRRVRRRNCWNAAEAARYLARLLRWVATSFGGPSRGLVEAANG